MIFSKEIEKCCAYCEHATKIATREQVLCPFKGIVDGAFYCRKFLYTPLKRNPKPQILRTNEYTKEDFQI